MERQNPVKGFEISEGKIPILLTLKRIAELKPHEETVAPDLQWILQALRRDPVLRHPIIADSSSGAVLDGTHRLAAISALGCLTIPVGIIDYQNPLVQVDRWFRIITGEKLQHFIEQIAPKSPQRIPNVEADRRLLSRESYATLRNRECLAFSSVDSNPLELCRNAFRLEEIARRIGMKITYVDNDDPGNLSNPGFLMSTIKLQKSEVVEGCLKHILFPPKSTRHLIPSRPLGVSVPLSLLKDPNAAEAEAEFEKNLRSRRVKRLPEGSRVGSRRYMEEVFLFE